MDKHLHQATLAAMRRVCDEHADDPRWLTTALGWHQLAEQVQHELSASASSHDRYRSRGHWSVVAGKQLAAAVGHRGVVQYKVGGDVSVLIYFT